MSIRHNSVAPRDCAMEIPIVMATAAQSPFFAGTKVWCSIGRHVIKIIGGNVLAPLPDIARHIVKAQLILRLGGHVVNSRHRFTQPVKATDEAPRSPASDNLREQIMCARPTRTIPRYLVAFVAATVNESVFTSWPTTGGVFPLSLRRQTKFHLSLIVGNGRPDLAGIDALEKTIGPSHVIPGNIFNRTSQALKDGGISAHHVQPKGP